MDQRSADVAVVGAGVAGLAGALSVRRHRLDTVVFDGGPPRNAQAREVHGYLGVSNQSGLELRELGRRQVLDVGARIVEARVKRITRDGSRFAVEAETGDTWRARRVLLATGVRDRYPDIAGFSDFFGRSVHVCPHCDGYEWRDRPVAVISWDEDTRVFALKLTDWTRDVTVVTDGRAPELDAAAREELAQHGIAVLTGTVERFEGEDGRLEALRFADGSRLPARAAFFSLGEEFQNELAVQLGCELTEDGCIAADEHLRTTVRGVWAAGDVVGQDQFAIVAASHGMRAGVDIYRSLSEFDEQPE